MTDLKKKIVEACRELLLQKIKEQESSIDDLSQSMEGEIKSPLGDKHETARARMQTEQSQLQRQLSEWHSQLSELDKLNHDAAQGFAFKGSLVQTNQGFFYISVPIGKIKTDDMEIFVISPLSPLGQLFMGLQTHSEFSLNGAMYRILNIW